MGEAQKHGRESCVCSKDLATKAGRGAIRREKRNMAGKSGGRAVRTMCPVAGADLPLVFISFSDEFCSCLLLHCYENSIIICSISL